MNPLKAIEGKESLKIGVLTTVFSQPRSVFLNTCSVSGIVLGIVDTDTKNETILTGSIIIVL